MWLVTEVGCVAADTDIRLWCPAAGAVAAAGVLSLGLPLPRHGASIQVHCVLLHHVLSVC